MSDLGSKVMINLSVDLLAEACNNDPFWIDFLMKRAEKEKINNPDKKLEEIYLESAIIYSYKINTCPPSKEEILEFKQYFEQLPAEEQKEWMEFFKQFDV